MQPQLFRLENTIHHYAWGSHTLIARCQERPLPTVEPEAELWMGGHPRASSRIQRGDRRIELRQAIAEDPGYWLGSAHRRDREPELPFLMKLLAAEKALSLQVHPDLQQAAAGYEAENSAAIPLGDPRRTYRDRNHKPELILALGEFWALSGFRPAAEIRANLQPVLDSGAAADRGACARLRRAVDALDSGSGSLQDFHRVLLTLDEHESQALQQAAAAVAGSIVGAEADTGAGRAAAAGWVLELQQQFPGDPGCLAPLYLNLVQLQPGQGLAMESGVVHAYLSGLGVEVMANSDNVIRAGLTQKHIDRTALAATAVYRSGRPQLYTAEPAGRGLEEYTTPFTEFRLYRLDPGGQNDPLVLDRANGAAGSGPRILLAGPGSRLQAAVADSGAESGSAVELGAGESAVIPAAVERVQIRGRGIAFLAAVAGARHG